MAFSVGFKIEPSLEDAMGKFKVDDSQRALVVVIDGEILKLEHGPTKKTADFGADLSEVRTHLEKLAQASFIILRVAEKKECALVMFVPEATKPKTKMMIASSALHLRNAANLGIAGEIHLEEVPALAPPLFGEETAEEREEMKTENEKNNEEIEKMEKAPMAPPVGGLPGVGCSIDADIRSAVTNLKAGNIRGFVAEIKGSTIGCDKEIAKDVETKDVGAQMPSDKPRYAVVQWNESTIALLYVCPPGCKPKERMPYASMKAAFVAQLGSLECKVDKKVEVDDAAEVFAAVEESLGPHPGEGDDAMKPIAPAKLGAKGPRMLI